jgi:hypothetical protein
MIANRLLDRLENVRKTGTGRWIACCPAHDDKRPSLSIRETDDGRVLLHCFTGCSVEEVLRGAALEIDALFPSGAGNPDHRRRGERRPFAAADVLRAVGHEATIVAIVAARLGNGHSPTPEDRARVLLAAERINAAIHEAGYA